MSFKNSFPGPDFSGGFLNSGASKGSSARLPLSESPDGFLIGPVGTGWTKIHQCETYALDEVYLWAANYSDSNIELTISVGFNAVRAGDYIEVPVTAADGFTLVWPGLPHKNLALYAKGSAGTITVGGFVMRHNPLAADNPNAGYGAAGSGN